MKAGITGFSVHFLRASLSACDNPESASHGPWAIARDPQVGAAISEGGAVRVVESLGARSITLPTVWLLYRVEQFSITVHEVRFSESIHERAGRG
jgi:hypothetical protein